MTKLAAIIFIFLLRTEHRQLQLTLRLPSKEKINQDIVIFSLQAILYPYYLHNIRSMGMQTINRIQNFDKILF